MKGETKQVNERRKMRKSEKGDRRGRRERVLVGQWLKMLRELGSGVYFNY